MNKDKVLGTISLAGLCFTLSVIVWFAFTEAKTVFDYVGLALFAIVNVWIMSWGWEVFFHVPKA